MFFVTCYYVAVIALILAALYTLYKIIWYSLKMYALSRRINRVGSASSRLTRHRGILGTIFGQKGAPDFTLSTDNDTYEVSILSFISTHSRWNIEKSREGYFAEARKKNLIFYKTEVHGAQPGHAIDYRRESRFQRSRLHLTPHGNVKQILMIYPTPTHLTYTQSQYEYLSAGSKIDSYTVMHANDLFAMFR